MENKGTKKLLSTAEVAKILGISRVAVFKKIQSGEIKAQKIGRNYVIESTDLSAALGVILSPERKKEIEKSVDKTVKEYGEALKMLGKE
ncbi:MAG: helix-turn-helix domain-containing protein [Candidatus Pacebacteria bacterium]|nr:helix-turn-helix domain-containing protein [Candidatus Paceibacterota bacterium]MDD5356961.1 helix-turn-helix domain-containing protein [Candidatus Paceibacterota bacterium]